MTSAEKARQAALDRIGDAYVYGAWDQSCTPSQRSKYARLNPSYADAIRNQCPRMKNGNGSCSGCKYDGRRIHDCRGLTSTCAAAAGIQINGQTVAKQWNADIWERKGSITELPKELPYVQLFRYNGTKWAHTGCYIGNGDTVDARGHASGTIRSKLASYKWTHWAVPRGMYNGSEQTEVHEEGIDVIYAARVTTSGGRLNIRCGPGTNCRVIGSFVNGEKVDVHAEIDTDDDGNPDWAYIAGDGTIGYVSMQYLTPIDRPESAQNAPKTENVETYKEIEKTQPAQSCTEIYGVWIPCDSEEEAQRYAGNIKRAVLVRYDKPPGEPDGEGE